MLIEIQEQKAAGPQKVRKGEVSICVASALRRLWRMTSEETRFYLREIHGHWTEPRISVEKVRELVRSALIETSNDGVSSVRLTRAGQRMKFESRPRNATDTGAPSRKRLRQRAPKPK